MKRPLGINLLAVLSLAKVAIYGALRALAVIDPPALSQAERCAALFDEMKHNR